MWESPGRQHGMRDAPPPPGFVSSGPSMPPPRGMPAHREHSYPQSQVEATGQLSSSLRPPLPAPAAASCSTHHRAGYTMPPPMGSEQEKGLTSRTRRGGQKPLTQGWSTVYLVYIARTQPWEVKTSLCCRGHGWCE